MDEDANFLTLSTDKIKDPKVFTFFFCRQSYNQKGIGVKNAALRSIDLYPAQYSLLEVLDIDFRGTSRVIALKCESMEILSMIGGEGFQLSLKRALNYH